MHDLTRIGLLTLIATLLVACGDRSTQVELPEGAVAGWHGGSLTLAEIEEALPGHRSPACRAMRRAENRSAENRSAENRSAENRSVQNHGAEKIVPCFREVAEDLAMESLLVAEIDDVTSTVDARLAEQPGYLRGAVLDAFYGQEATQMAVTDAEVESFFAANGEQFNAPARLTLLNLFRRHDDPEAPEVTMTQLGELKARAQGGENFADLAREHSHSETRIRGGLVGQVEEGDLPSDFERIVFALTEGEISQPFEVEQGAMIVMARQMVPRSEPSLESVRGRVHSRLVAKKMAEKVAARLAAIPLPEGSTVISGDDLITSLDSGEGARPVLEIGDFSLDVAEMRRISGLGDGEAAALDAPAKERLLGIYERRRDRQRFAQSLLTSEEETIREMRTLAEQHARGMAQAELLGEALELEVQRHLEASPEKLRRYFEDNRALFQSPPRFNLHLWSLPFDDQAPAQLARLEQLRSSLVAGEMDLLSAMAQLGGEITELGWRTVPEAMAELPAKARHHLLKTEAGSFSVPFQWQQAHHLLWVEQRDEPSPREFARVENEVRHRYLERFGESEHRETVSALLDEKDFLFDPEAVLQALGGLEPNPSAGREGD